jgi:hypothetical protein
MEQVDYTKGAPPDYRCSKCATHGVKLWRQYQTVASAIELLCAKCAVQNQETDADCVPLSAADIDDEGRWHGGIGGASDSIGWLVPAVPDEEGESYWGYTSVPDAGVRWWRRLPTHATADEAGPS